VREAAVEAAAVQRQHAAGVQRTARERDAQLSGRALGDAQSASTLGPSFGASPPSTTPAVRALGSLAPAPRFSTHEQQSAAKGSSTTVSRSDIPINITF
jgi:hypothetical protein